MGKQSKNLSLPPAAIERAERYSELHGTNVSQLVGDFLAALPLPEDIDRMQFTPTVSRLFGIVKGSSEPIRAYQEYLIEKYGQ